MKNNLLYFTVILGIFIPFFAHFLIEKGFLGIHAQAVIISVITGSLISLIVYSIFKNRIIQRLDIFLQFLELSVKGIEDYRKGIKTADNFGYKIEIDGSDTISEIQKLFNKLIFEVKYSYIQHKIINDFSQLTDRALAYHQLHEETSKFLLKTFSLQAIEVYYRDQENTITRVDRNMDDLVPLEEVIIGVDEVFETGKAIYIETDPTEISGIADTVQLLPLKHENFVFGVVCCYTIGRLDSSENDTLNILTHQYALAHQSAVQYSKLQEMATKDELTSIFNRRFGMMQTKDILHRAEIGGDDVCVIVMDIDKFKNINDTYGHQAGDFVLKHYAKAISSKVRSSDVFLRYGGEEFMFVMSKTSVEISFARCEEIRLMISEMDFIWKNIKIPVSMSMGLMCTTSSGGKTYSIDKLIHFADIALYHSKHNGRNQTTIGEFTEEILP